MVSDEENVYLVWIRQRRNRNGARIGTETEWPGGEEGVRGTRKRRRRRERETTKPPETAGTKEGTIDIDPSIENRAPCPDNPAATRGDANDPRRRTGAGPPSPPVPPAARSVPSHGPTRHPPSDGRIDRWIRSGVAGAPRHPVRHRDPRRFGGSPPDPAVSLSIESILPKTHPPPPLWFAPDQPVPDATVSSSARMA